MAVRSFLKKRSHFHKYLQGSQKLSRMPTLITADDKRNSKASNHVRGTHWANLSFVDILEGAKKKKKGNGYFYSDRKSFRQISKEVGDSSHLFHLHPVSATQPKRLDKNDNGVQLEDINVHTTELKNYLQFRPAFKR